MSYGPNSNNFGGFQVIYLLELVTQFALRCIAGLIEGNYQSVEVTSEAYWRFAQELDGNDANMIYRDSRVSNYYRNEHGRSAVNGLIDIRKDVALVERSRGPAASRGRCWHSTAFWKRSRGCLIACLQHRASFRTCLGRRLCQPLSSPRRPGARTSETAYGSATARVVVRSRAGHRRRGGQDRARRGRRRDRGNDRRVDDYEVIGPRTDVRVLMVTRPVSSRERTVSLAATVEAEYGADKLSLALEETEAALALVAAKLDSVTPDREPRRRNANRGWLPAHLECVEQVIDLENAACPAAVARFTSSARTSPSGST